MLDHPDIQHPVAENEVLWATERAGLCRGPQPVKADNFDRAYEP